MRSPGFTRRSTRRTRAETQSPEKWSSIQARASAGSRSASSSITRRSAVSARIGTVSARLGSGFALEEKRRDLVLLARDLHSPSKYSSTAYAQHGRRDTGAVRSPSRGRAVPRRAPGNRRPDRVASRAPRSPPAPPRPRSRRRLPRPRTPLPLPWVPPTVRSTALRPPTRHESSAILLHRKLGLC